MKNHLFLILTKKSQKIISLFDLLINEDRWFRISEISNHLDLATRSTQRYVTDLFDIIHNYNELYGDTIELLLTKNNGVKLIVTNGMMSFWNFIRYITINDEIFELSRSIIFGQFKNPILFASKKNLSHAQVTSSLKKFNEFCTLSGVSFSNTDYEVVGNEKSIRIITYSMTWFLNRGNFWPKSHSEIDETKLSGVVNRLIEKYNFKIVSSKKRKLTYFIATNLLRIRKKKSVTMQDEWIDFFEDDLSGIVGMVTELYREYHVYNKAEIYFLSTYWQSETKLYMYQNLDDEVLHIHKKNQSTMYQITKTFYELFSTKIIRIPPKTKDKLFKDAFFSHLNCSISKTNDYFNFDTILLQTNSTIYPFLKDKLLALIDELYDITQNPVFFNKEVLLRVYMLIYSSIKSLTDYEPAIYIYLETDLPSTEEVCIKNYILDYFQSAFNLIFIDCKLSKKADIILSSIPLIEEEDHYLIKVMSDLKAPVSHRSMKNLEEKLFQISQNKS